MVRELNEHEINALHYELLLKDILAMAERLPPFPDIVWKVVPLIRKMAPVSEIEAVIKYDQTIAARILALSQSPYYCRRKRVASLQDAIVSLGNERLVQVIMIACSSRYFHNRPLGSNGSERDLWQHSVSSALTGEIVARHLKQPKALTVYTASLLHDIGKTVLDLYSKIYLGSSLSQMHIVGMDSIAAERKALGIDHQELGEVIARRWQFPREVITAIGHHHTPHKARSDQMIAAIVYVANRIVHSEKREGGVEAVLDPERDLVFRKLGITSALVEEFRDQLSHAQEGVLQFLTTR